MRFETVHLSGAARLITGQPRGDGAIGTPSAAAMGPQTLGAKAGVGNAERRRAASGKSRSTPLPDSPQSFEIKVTVEPSAMLALRLHVDGYSVSERIDREGFDAANHRLH